MSDLEQRKLLSALSHGSIFFSTFMLSIIVPIIVLVVSSDRVVQSNAKEAINFHLNLYIYGFILLGLYILNFLIQAPLIAPLLLVSLFILLIIASWIMPIIAMVRATTHIERPYRYPFIIHIL